MRTAVPRSTESAADLKQRRPRDHDGRTHPRRPLLSLLASAHAATRHDVAHRLGLRRTTVGRWVARYETGGTTALLAIHTPLGKPPSLASAILASSAQALRNPPGWGAYEDLRQWVERTQHVRVKDKPRSTSVRTRCKTTLMVPRPSHTQTA